MFMNMISSLNLNVRAIPGVGLRLMRNLLGFMIVSNVNFYQRSENGNPQMMRNRMTQTEDPEVISIPSTTSPSQKYATRSQMKGKSLSDKLYHQYIYESGNVQ